jgi:hypothetical protein
MARSKMTDGAAMVMEEWHRPSSGDWPIAVSAPRRIYVAQAISLTLRLLNENYEIQDRRASKGRMAVDDELQIMRQDAAANFPGGV